MSIVSRRSQRVYVAAPISTYQTRRYERMLDAVRRRFPLHHVLAARDLGFTPETWLPRWQRLLARLDNVVAFADGSGVIGAAVLWEVLDARLLGIPVHILTGEGRFVPLHRVSIGFVAGRSLRRFARIRVTGGRPGGWSVPARKVH